MEVFYARDIPLAYEMRPGEGDNSPPFRFFETEEEARDFARDKVEEAFRNYAEDDPGNSEYTDPGAIADCVEDDFEIGSFVTDLTWEQLEEAAALLSTHGLMYF